MAQLIGASPVHQKVAGSIPDQDVYRKQPIDVSLSLKINGKIFLGEDLKKKQLSNVSFNPNDTCH